MAALSGSEAKAPGFAGGWLLFTDDIGRDRLRISACTGRIWFTTYQDVVTRERRYVHMPEADIADLRAREASGVWNNLKVDDPHVIGIGDHVMIVTIDRKGVVTAKLSSNRYKVEVGNKLTVTVGGHQLRQANGNGNED
jgi:hypothetical protein